MHWFGCNVTWFMCLCRVQYTSGEVEELNLEEIITDGHMSILMS